MLIELTVTNSTRFSNTLSTCNLVKVPKKLRYTKNHTAKQEADWDHSSAEAVEIPLACLSKQTHAVRAAVTDHVALTEVIFFNSLPWRAIEHSGRRGRKPCQLVILPKAQVFPLSAICRVPSAGMQGLRAALSGALVGSSSPVLSPALSPDSHNSHQHLCATDQARSHCCTFR